MAMPGGSRKRKAAPKRKAAKRKAPKKKATASKKGWIWKAFTLKTKTGKVRKKGQDRATCMTRQGERMCECRLEAKATQKDRWGKVYGKPGTWYPCGERTETWGNATGRG